MLGNHLARPKNSLQGKGIKILGKDMLAMDKGKMAINDLLEEARESLVEGLLLFVAKVEFNMLSTARLAC